MRRFAITSALVIGVLIAPSGASWAASTVTHQSSSYCKKADHGKTGKDKAGKKVKCVSYTAWHWKHV